MLIPLFLNFLYSLTFVVGKVVLDFSHPFFFVAVRMIGSGLVSFLIYFAMEKSFRKILDLHFSDWLLIIFIGLTNIYVTNAFEFWGLQYLTAAKSAFIYNLTPFFGALISFFMFSEKMTAKKWIGLLLGFFGVMPLLTQTGEVLDTTYKIGFLSTAELALLSSSLATALGWNSIRYFMKHEHKIVSPFIINGFSMMFGGVLCLGQSFAFESSPMIFGVTYWYAGFIFAILIATLVISYNLHSFLLKTYTATFLFFFGFTCPLITAILGAIFLHEPITYRFVISAVLVFIGLWFFYQEELSQGYIKH